MKKTTLIIFVLAAALWIGCQKPASKSDTNLSEIRLEVTSIVQAVLDLQYGYLTNNDAPPLQPKDFSAYMVIEKPELYADLEHFKSELSKIGISYTAYTSRIDLKKLSIEQNILNVQATDSYTLTSNVLDPDKKGGYITTEGSYDYDIALRKEGEQWKIIRYEYLGENPWFINVQPEIGLSILPSRDNNNSYTEKAFTYNPTNAKNYAYAYWSSPNPNFCDFASNGDCTNFLSQCLQAGGWTQNSTWWATSGASRCCTGNCLPLNVCFKCSWTVAHSFYTYVLGSGRIFSGCYIDNALNVGDIIQYDLNGNNDIDHSSLVTKKTTSTNGTIVVYVTYRNAISSSPAKDKLSSTVPGVHYGWMVKSSAN